MSLHHEPTLPAGFAEGDMTLGEVGRTVVRLEAKLDRLMDDHEHRIRRVERWTYTLPPTILLAAGSAAAAFLSLQ